MGTNYYIKSHKCSHCGRSDIPKHIGKSSAGWCFSLRLYPDENINSLEDWKRILNEPNTIIEDEYGRTTEANVLIDNITKRTYDYIVGEFS